MLLYFELSLLFALGEKIGMMEKKMETTKVSWGIYWGIVYIGIVNWRYIEIMEKNMKTTI